MADVCYLSLCVPDSPVDAFNQLIGCQSKSHSTQAQVKGIDSPTNGLGRFIADVYSVSAQQFYIFFYEPCNVIAI